jgi:small-conductance mechanosensitive channel
MSGQWGRMLLLLILLSGLSSASAQRLPNALGAADSENTPSLPEELRADQVDAFVAPLSETEARRLLIDELRQRSTTASPVTGSGMRGAAGFLEGLHSSTTAVRERIARLGMTLDALPDTMRYMFRNLTDAGGWRSMARGAGVFILLVFAGLAAERALTRQLAPLLERLGVVEQAQRWPMLAGRSLIRALLELLATGTFALTGFLLSLLFFERFDPMRYFLLTYLATIVAIRVGAIVLRMPLAPAAPDIRMLPLSDQAARKTYRSLLLLVGVSSFAVFSGALFSILGLPDILHDFWLICFGLVGVVLIASLLWAFRESLSTATLQQSGAGRQLKQSWHLVAIAYLGFVWIIWGLNLLLGRESAANAALLSLIVVLLIPLVDRGLERLLARLAARQLGEEADPVERARVDQFTGVLRLSMRGLLAAVAVLALAEAWGIHVVAVFEDPVYGAVAKAVLNILVTLLLGYVVWGFVRLAIDRHLPSRVELGERELGSEGGGAGGTRAETLLPLLRSFLFLVILVISVLVVLSALGVNIGPLLAGASIVGLAIGFGSQRLVQDIVSGIFFLVDDAFRVGEYIEAGGMTGTVESISVRSMRLRHHLGSVQTLPYGEIAAVRNHSRDWVIMKLELRMPYETDIEKVRKIIKRVGQEMLQDPEFGQHFLQPLKSQGVLRVEESALIIRMKFTAVPGEQWVIRREAYRRVRDALAEAGIFLAHREVLVRLPEDRAAGRENAEAAGAALATSLAADQASRRVDPGGK